MLIAAFDTIKFDQTYKNEKFVIKNNKNMS